MLVVKKKKKKNTIEKGQNKTNRDSRFYGLKKGKKNCIFYFYLILFIYNFLENYFKTSLIKKQKKTKTIALITMTSKI